MSLREDIKVADIKPKEPDMKQSESEYQKTIDDYETSIHRYNIRVGIPKIRSNLTYFIESLIPPEYESGSRDYEYYMNNEMGSNLIKDEVRLQKDLEDPDPVYKEMVISFNDKHNKLIKKSNELRSISDFGDEGKIQKDLEQQKLIELWREVYELIQEIYKYLITREKEYDRAKFCVEYARGVRKLKEIVDELPSNAPYLPGYKPGKNSPEDIMKQIMSLIYNAKRISNNVQNYCNTRESNEQGK